MWAIHSRLDHLVSYVSNKEKTINPDFENLASVIEYAGTEYKTEQRFYVSGINCNPETAYDSMMNAHRKNDKTIKVVGYHGYQSFAKGEVTAETAHEIGLKLAQELWGERFQVIVATHLNTNHYHNHFVLCSTSFLDGKRFNACMQSYLDMRKSSDRLCKEYSLSVIENPKRFSTKHYTEYMAEREGKPTLRRYIRDDIDTAIIQSTTKKHFLSIMEDMGYTFDFNPNHKYPTLQKKDAERCCRFASLGSGYDYPEILARIGKRMMRETPPKPPNISYNKYFGKAERKGRLKGFKRIYTRYMFLMGIIPKGNPIKPTHPLIRQAVIQMRQIQKEYKLIEVNSITTDKQLLYFKQSCEEVLKNLCDKRNENRRFIRNEKNPNRLILLKNQGADLTTEISELRQKCKLCDYIQSRSAEMQEQLAQISLEEKNQIKEENRNEHIGRSGRPNR